MNNKIIKIAVVGAYGRMGKSIIQEVKKYKNILCVCGVVKKKNHDILFNDNKKIKITENIIQEINNFDVLIDFSTPKNTLNNLYICQKYNKKIIIGTTGFTEDEICNIKKYSKNFAIVFSENFSIGINLIFQLLKKTIKVLNNYDIEILEKHHRNKIDAPSGTALKIGEIISKYNKWDINQCSIYRKKEITHIRKRNKIGFSIIRGGDIIGEHQIMFLGHGENIIFKHQATNRHTFSHGAIQAAIWIMKKQNGFFNMIDVLNILK